MAVPASTTLRRAGELECWESALARSKKTAGARRRLAAV